MKRSIILISLLLGSLFSKSQYSSIKIKTLKNSRGVWNSFTKKYDFENYNYAKITFSINNDYISADDESRSIYRIMENIPVKKDIDKETISVYCLDEKNRKCVFAIMRYNDGKTNSSVAVIYDEVMYVYIVDSDELITD